MKEEREREGRKTKGMEEKGEKEKKNNIRIEDMNEYKERKREGWREG